jgi:hypothetical protein
VAIYRKSAEGFPFQMGCTKMLDFSNEKSKKDNKNVLSARFDRLGQKIDRLGQAPIPKKEHS